MAELPIIDLHFAHIKSRERDAKDDIYNDHVIISQYI